MPLMSTSFAGVARRIFIIGMQALAAGEEAGVVTTLAPWPSTASSTEWAAT